MKKLVMFFILSFFVIVITGCPKDTTQDSSTTLTTQVTTSNTTTQIESTTTTEIESTTTTQDDNTPDKLVIGFVPFSSSNTIMDSIQPMTDLLSQSLGIEVEAQVMTNYYALVEAMGTNQIQIGFLPAFTYAVANEQYGVEVILKPERYGSGTYRGQYVVKVDSGIESIDDLQGKTWAYVDTTSTTGYLYPASQIMDLYPNIETVETNFFGDTIETGSHDSAILAVLFGDADVATTFDDARRIVEYDYPNVMDDLKVIGYTDPIPNEAISVVAELDDELVQEIKDAFYELNMNSEMLQVLQEVFMCDALLPAEDSEYDVVRSTYNKFKDII